LVMAAGRGRSDSLGYREHQAIRCAKAPRERGVGGSELRIRARGAAPRREAQLMDRR
jgi:hypothetical protein